MLLQFWKDGMTSTKSSCEELIENAAQASGLSETQVKNWIGNERKRLGLCRKRGPRPQKEGNKVPCKTRKKSAYQLFKSDFLKSDTARQLRKGFSDGEVQRRGNAVWRNIGVGERQRWEELAEEENMNPPQKEETKISRAKKLSSHIRTCIDQLDQLGYPSMWLGLINGVPERHISVKIKEMAEDETITNYVLSAIVKITAKEKMAAESHIEGDKDTPPENSNAMEKSGHSVIDDTPSPSSSTMQEPETMASSVLLLDKKGQAPVAEGEKVTNSLTVHGRTLTAGWGAFLVKRLLKTSVEPWKDFPTHSGEVEEDSFIAWPLTHIKAKEPDKKPKQNTKRHKKNEASSLIDSLHPGMNPSSRTTRSANRT
ncbi:hypothetical protein AC249_AIPGENE6492 [Exaiptasia diaphana]|nr:hypothetical protein AC249_AIPGENE6492 [Exaiptasia diaphana]